MNKNTITGVWQSAKGKVKEEAGHAVGNSELEAEGVGDQLKGAVNQKIGEVKDAIKKGVDTVLGKS